MCSVLTPIPEVVLSLMLLKFKFEPTNKEIKWNISGIRFPTVGDATKPSLPLKLSMYKEPVSSA